MTHPDGSLSSAGCNRGWLAGQIRLFVRRPSKAGSAPRSSLPAADGQASVRITPQKNRRGGGEAGEAVMALDEKIVETDALIESQFHDHPHADVILSMPGYIPGVAVNRATGSYRGQGVTDTRDDHVIADQTSDAACRQAAVTANLMALASILQV